ncbi:MAG: DinB family protein [Pyrinomonadaceae bacterium]
MIKEMVETWNIHNRVNLYLLDAVSPKALDSVSASKGRTVAEQFAHIHNVRLMWLKEAAPELLGDLKKIEKDEGVDKKLLTKSLKASGAAIAALLEEKLGENGRIKNFKPHPTAFFGYIISHESHHRGQLVLTLKQAGHPIDKSVGYGVWEWGTR